MLMRDKKINHNNTEKRTKTTDNQLRPLKQPRKPPQLFLQLLPWQKEHKENSSFTRNNKQHWTASRGHIEH